MRIHHLTAAILVATVSVPVFAWGPYGPDPYGPFGYAGPGPLLAPAPDPFAVPPAPPDMPFGPPAPMDLPAPPEGLTEEAPPTPGAAPTMALPRRSQLSISRQATGQDYLIEIRLANIDPDQVRIVPQGRGLRIAYQTQAQDYQEDDLGAAYRRGYSFIRGSASRHLSLPPDADLAAMSREVTTDRILLRIPRWDLGRSSPRPIPPRIP